MWIGHEPDYFSVVRFVVQNGRLPERSDYEGTERGADIAQATQPPLFFYAALPVVALIDDGSDVPPGKNPRVICEGVNPLSYSYMLTTDYNLPPRGAAAAGYMLRLMNLLFSIGMMLIVYRIVREIAIGSHFTALIAVAFAGFQPHLFDLSIFISNESLLLLISSINLFFALRLVQYTPETTLRISDLAGLILTGLMGPLTKTNGYVLLISTGMVLIYLILHQMFLHPRSRTTRILVLSAGVLLLGMIAVSVFNYIQYDSVVGRYRGLFDTTFNQLNDISQTKITATLRDTYYNSKSGFPFTQKKLIWLYTAGTLAGLFLFVGRTGLVILQGNSSLVRIHVVLLGYLLVAIVLVLLRGNLVSDLVPDKAFAPVRYYISGLPALAVMLALGWQTLIPSRLPNILITYIGEQRARFYCRWLAWNWPGLLWALVWFAIVTWNVAQGVRDFSSRDIISSDDLEQLIARQAVTPVTANLDLPPYVPRLRAYDYTVGEDGILHLAAYMQVDEIPSQNYAARVVLSDGKGNTSTCELIPYKGHYTVTRWEPGRIVKVPMDIPNCAESGNALTGPLNLTLDWLPANAEGAFITPDADAVHTISVMADLPRAQYCLESLGLFDNTFQVIKYTAPTATTAGAVYLPAVNWYVRAEINDNNLSRFYTVTHDTSGQYYTCEGIPRLGNHPISRWKRGETIYFDQCALHIPPEAPAGEYTVALGMVDNSTGDYLPITADQGNISSQGLLNVAELIVR